MSRVRVCFSLFLFPAVVTSLLLHLNSCPSEVQPLTHSIKFYLLMVKGMTSERLISVRSSVGTEFEESFITVVLNSVISRKFSLKWKFV